MADTGSLTTFIIVSFLLGGYLVWKKDTLPYGARRGLALLAIVMITMSFGLIVYSFFVPALP